MKNIALFAQIWAGVLFVLGVAMWLTHPICNSSKFDRARMDLGNIRSAAKAYTGKYGHAPAQTQQLVNTLLLEHLPVDPWGTEYIFVAPYAEMLPVSAGPDEKFGTCDDVTLARAGQCPPPPPPQIRWY